MRNLTTGTSAMSIVPSSAPCQEPGCSVSKTSQKCTMCDSHFCGAHLYEPQNELVRASRIMNCAKCARKSFDLEFVATVQSALSLLFGLGLKGVTIHAPGGKTCYYGTPMVEDGISGIETLA